MACLLLIEYGAGANASYSWRVQGGDVNESLQEIIRRVLRVHGIENVMALHWRLDRVTCETARKLAPGGQRGTREIRVFRDRPSCCALPRTSSGTP